MIFSQHALAMHSTRHRAMQWLLFAFLLLLSKLVQKSRVLPLQWPILQYLKWSLFQFPLP